MSGDFYQAFAVKIEDGQVKHICVVADCTGHGVPGAMMSVLGINIINKIVNEKGVTDPALIMQLLNDNIKKSLSEKKLQDEIHRDGMDIAVFTFLPDQMILHYCIGRMTHFLVRNRNISTLDTHRHSIGYSGLDENGYVFQTSQCVINNGDSLYVFSDGFQDQFGGNADKKFKKSSVRTLINKLSPLHMKVQKVFFVHEFKEWQNGHPQTDDVLVVGIRFNESDENAQII